jgi:hypothetical protein
MMLLGIDATTEEVDAMVAEIDQGIYACVLLI